jgi:hypothetical protein
MKKRTVINPRYPHIIKITRVVTKKVDVPVSEAIADIDEDDPLADQDAVDESTTEHTELTEEEVVLYDGKGRSYTDTTTTGNKVVDENKIRIKNKDSVAISLTVVPKPSHENETWYKVTQAVARGLMMVRTIGISYRNQYSMSLPGFMPTIGDAF